MSFESPRTNLEEFDYMFAQTVAALFPSMIIPLRYAAYLKLMFSAGMHHVSLAMDDPDGKSLAWFREIVPLVFDREQFLFAEDEYTNDDDQQISRAKQLMELMPIRPFTIRVVRLCGHCKKVMGVRTPLEGKPIVQVFNPCDCYVQSQQHIWFDLLTSYTKNEDVDGNPI